MKALRIAYYIIFTLSALVSVNFILAAFQYRFNVVDWGLLIIALIIFAVQIAGLIAVIFDMNKVVMCILSFAAGIATLSSGAAALSALVMPAPQLISVIAFTSLGISILVFGAHIFSGVMFIFYKGNARTRKKQVITN